ncbi:MAG: formylglycine-generating enzyme family protein [Deltaproteobacteria bacterium]|nr:formylglycine-generating enzyme family protein [Deltaproteobacteria bacterium]
MNWQTSPVNPARLLLLAAVLSLACGTALAEKVVESQGIRFRLIPGGRYTLGSPLTESGRYADEPLPHQVALKPFYISETEITNAQYQRFVQATGHRPPLYWRDQNLNAPEQPVVGVTWFDAVAFADWLTQTTGIPHRLPYEREWEAAARGGLEGQPFPWGREAPHAGGLYRANYYPNDFDDDGFRLTAPVGSFPPNGFGLFDMAGNVAEWCLDRFFKVARRGPYTNPEARVLKGGSWYSRARDLRCAARRFAAPQNADGFIGFRVVRECN